MANATATPAPLLHTLELPTRWSLKAYKEMKQLSQETRCFHAKLAMDGKVVAEVSNDGWGGPHLFRFTSKDAEAAFTAEAKAVYPDLTYEPEGALVDAMAEERELAAMARRYAKRGLPITVVADCTHVTEPIDYYTDTAVLGLVSLEQLEPELAKLGAVRYRFISGAPEAAPAPAPKVATPAKPRAKEHTMAKPNTTRTYTDKPRTKEYKQMLRELYTGDRKMQRSRCEYGLTADQAKRARAAVAKENGGVPAPRMAAAS